MKYTDDYEAKLKLWARNPQVFALPKPANLPPFRPQKFNSYAEFNAWKESYLLEIVRRGGIRWTK